MLAQLNLQVHIERLPLLRDRTIPEKENQDRIFKTIDVRGAVFQGDGEIEKAGLNFPAKLQ